MLQIGGNARVMLRIVAAQSNNCQIILELFGYHILRKCL